MPYPFEFMHLLNLHRPILLLLINKKVAELCNSIGINTISSAVLTVKLQQWSQGEALIIENLLASP